MLDELAVVAVVTWGLSDRYTWLTPHCQPELRAGGWNAHASPALRRLVQSEAGVLRNAVRFRPCTGPQGRLDACRRSRPAPCRVERKHKSEGIERCDFRAFCGKGLRLGRSLLPILICGCALAACGPLLKKATPMTEVQQDDQLRANGLYLIARGDEVDIVHLVDTDYNAVVSVKPDGKISVPGIPMEVTAAGRTTKDVVTDLADLYRKYAFIKQPNFSIIVRNFASQQVFIGGEVQHPGYLELPSGDRYRIPGADGGRRHAAHRAHERSHHRAQERVGPADDLLGQHRQDRQRGGPRAKTSSSILSIRSSCPGPTSPTPTSGSISTSARCCLCPAPPRPPTPTMRA